MAILGGRRDPVVGYSISALSRRHVSGAQLASTSPGRRGKETRILTILLAVGVLEDRYQLPLGNHDLVEDAVVGSLLFETHCVEVM